MNATRRPLARHHAAALSASASAFHVPSDFLIRCYRYVARAADGISLWQPLQRVEWVNPALGLASVRNEDGVPLLCRGEYAIELAGAIARAQLGGWFGRWRGEQLELGAVKWRGGVATPTGGVIRRELIDEDDDEESIDSRAPLMDDAKSAFNPEVMPCGSDTPQPVQEQHSTRRRGSLLAPPPLAGAGAPGAAGAHNAGTLSSTLRPATYFGVAGVAHA